MNKCVITGKLVKDPELRSSGEYKVCEFTLATNRPTNRDGERVADFINCRVWNNQAENLVKYQSKGNLIAVFGEIRTDNYEVNGTKKYKTYVLANNIEFLESKKNDIPLEKLTTKTDFDKTGQIQISEDDYPF